MGFCACLLILAAWAVSLWSYWQMPIGDRWFVDGNRHGLFVGVDEITGPKSLGTPFFWWVEWKGYAFEAPELVYRPGLTCLMVPFWLLFLVAALPTVLLFLRDRRRTKAGYCRHCAYDLRGIASGICPECGNACPLPLTPPDLPPPSPEKNAKVG